MYRGVIGSGTVALGVYSLYKTKNKVYTVIFYTFITINLLVEE